MGAGRMIAVIRRAGRAAAGCHAPRSCKWEGNSTCLKLATHRSWRELGGGQRVVEEGAGALPDARERGESQFWTGISKSLKRATDPDSEGSRGLETRRKHENIVSIEEQDQFLHPLSHRNV